MEDYRHELKHRYRTYFGVYNRYSVPGFVLLFHGICIFGLGCFDIGWTVSRYDVNTCTPDPTMPGMCRGNHIFTLIGSSLWGGALIIIVSVMALWMPHRYIAHSCMFQFYTALTFINVIAVAPAIVVLHALEISLNQNVFYTYTPVSGFQVGDMAKFAVVFAIGVLAAVAFLAMTGMLLIACLCPAPKKYRRYYKRPFADWHLPHPHLPHFPRPHLPHFAPRQNPAGRPMMHNPGWLPSMYGGAGYAPYTAPAPAAMPAPQAAPLALPALPYYDPYRYYNAMAGGYGPGGDGGYGYDREDPRRGSGRRGRRQRRGSDYSSDYSY